MLALRFAYPIVLYLGLSLGPLFVLLKKYLFKKVVYRYTLTNYIVKHSNRVMGWQKYCIYALRALVYCLLITLAARPQWIDAKSKLQVEGIDIVLAVDMSESMLYSDDYNDRRRRIEVAKGEALSFIEKRINDQIALVVFAQDTLSLSPLTLDKNMLAHTIKNLQIGVVDSSSTALGKGLVSAVLRLRNSDAKSKIVVLLTDGVPTGDDIPIEKAIEIAMQMQVKVYAIGFGSQAPFLLDNYGRMLGSGDGTMDMNLLKKIAEKTGGRAFYARNPQDLKSVYQEIDSLERRKTETDIFNNYFEAFWLFFIPLLFLLFIESILSCWVFRSLAW